jgi:hypothetical protein
MHEIRVECVVLITFVSVIGEETTMNTARRTFRHDEQEKERNRRKVMKEIERNRAKKAQERGEIL